jgi:hypothetical protein
MEDRIAFGEYTPDLPPLVNSGLSVARNTVPVQSGYQGINKLVDFADFTALDDRARGAIAGIDPEGNPYNFAGTETNLWASRAVTEKVSFVDDAYNCSGELYWEFVVYGSQGKHHVVAVNSADDTQYFTLGISEDFKQLGNPDLTGTVAPRGKHVGVIANFLMLGNTYDLVNGQDDTAIHWSAIDDIFNWPTPGSDVASAVQSGRQPLQGNGGSVQRVVSGSEVGAVFQENSIWRVDYRGGDVVFELSRVEPERGLLIPAVALPFGRQVFYLAEDGFYLFDYTTSTPIGRERVDRTFLADVDSEFFHRVSAIEDPDTQRIHILYPGSGHSGGTPNKMLIYDWGLNRWSHAEVTAEWLTLSVAAGVDLDLPSPGTPDDPDASGEGGTNYPEGGVDGIHSTTTVPLSSFDQRVAATGALRMGAYSTSDILQGFTGTRLAATLETGRRELIPGSRALAIGARPLVDSADPTVQVASLSRANKIGKFSNPAHVKDDDGQANFRVDGRYHSFRVNLPAGWDNALAMDVMFNRSGTR